MDKGAAAGTFSALVAPACIYPAGRFYGITEMIGFAFNWDFGHNMPF
tara:strand:+ start:60 stop:200 length:141 start_codon:yes stop_codon:yes gene_type:complete